MRVFRTYPVSEYLLRSNWVDIRVDISWLLTWCSWLVVDWMNVGSGVPDLNTGLTGWWWFGNEYLESMLQLNDGVSSNLKESWSAGKRLFLVYLLLYCCWISILLLSTLINLNLRIDQSRCKGFLLDREVIHSFIHHPSLITHHSLFIHHPSLIIHHSLFIHTYFFTTLDSALNLLSSQEVSPSVYHPTGSTTAPQHHSTTAPHQHINTSHILGQLPPASSTTQERLSFHFLFFLSLFPFFFLSSFFFHLVSNWICQRNQYTILLTTFFLCFL